MIQQDVTGIYHFVVFRPFKAAGTLIRACVQPVSDESLAAALLYGTDYEMMMPAFCPRCRELVRAALVIRDVRGALE